MGRSHSEIRATGGFTKSKAWVKMLADVLGEPLGVLEHTEGSALRGAFLAWYALGQINSLEECAKLVPAHVERPESAKDLLVTRMGINFLKNFVSL